MRNSNVYRCAVSVLAVLIASISAAWAQGTATEERLRGQLRQATIQLRNMQDQNATLQSMQAQSERERMELAEKFAASEKELAGLRQQLRASQTASETAAERLKSQQDAYARTDAQNRETFEKLQAAFNETTEMLRLRDAEATRLGTTLTQVRGQAQACEAKNGELYKLGIAVLDGYSNRGILDTLGGIEPFTRLKRVEYEKAKQDYEDKLRANEIRHPIR